MKNIIKPILIVLLISSIILNIFFVCKYFDNKYIITNPLERSNLLSIMLQDNEGNYVKSDRTTWPTEEEGYYFSSSLSWCENGSELSWENNKVRVKTISSDKCYIYFSHEKEFFNITEKLLADANKLGQTPTLYYHDGDAADSGSNQEARDYSYRYSGASDKVNNYVCIDSKTEGSCDNNDLYRIIGLFKNSDEQYEMKLIKYDYATEDQLGTNGARTTGSNYSSYSDKQYYKGKLSTIPRYYWTSSENRSNLWKGSTLYETNLNGTFLTALEGKLGVTEDNSPITTHDWITAGNTWANIAMQTVATVYQNEIKQYDRGTTNPNASVVDEKTPAKIGLMYVSDYGFATSPENWETNLFDDRSQDYRLDNVKNNNWMYMGLHEWTITRQANSSDCVFYIYDLGRVSSDGVHSLNNAVRPSFYLSSDTKFYSGGNGTIDTPYRIEI